MGGEGRLDVEGDVDGAGDGGYGEEVIEWKGAFYGVGDGGDDDFSAVGAAAEG